VGSFDGKVYALNATTGAFVWSYTTANSVESSPAVAGGVVYVGSDDDKVYAFGVHDVAVTNVTSSKNGCLPMQTVGQGFSATINVTVANQGGYTETFNVIAYANATAIQTETLTLTSQNSTTLTITWNTTGFGYGNYRLSAYAWPVPDETDTSDNAFGGGSVTVTIVGDVNGDLTVDLFDAILISGAFGAQPPSPNWNANADINGDGIVDILDAILLGATFGQTVT
jgi:hypothetical protein